MANVGNWIKLTDILNEIISEVGDLENIEPYEFDYDSWESSFYTEDGDLVVMRTENETDKLRSLLTASKIFEKEKNEIYNISFEVNGVDTQAKKTTLQEFIKILKTVSIYAKNELERINSGLTREDKPIFIIGAQSKKSSELKSDPQKIALYANIISKNLPDNYRTQEGKVLRLPVILIQRIK